MYGFSLKVYGCQMNVYDGDRIRTALESKGWRETPEDDSDVVIFVTCSIRDKAEHKVWSELGRFGKKDSPVVAVVGCMAQRVGEKLQSRFPFVRLVAGPRNLGRLPEHLEKVLSDGSPCSLLDSDPRELNDLDVAPMSHENPWKAYITIAHGCDNFCSYCIVPYVRGRFQSRRREDIFAEMESLAAAGVREITLIGQNVNTYGRDNDDGYYFSHLLTDAAAIRGVDLIRFATSHPRDFTPDVVEAMEKNPSICPGINLPIQSGSDRILKLMKRGYSFSEYAEKVEMIRNALPHAGITSDLIAGYPGETEEDFNDSMEALRLFRFDLVHTAAFSPREGTPAAASDEQLPRKTIMERLNRLNRLQSEISLEKNRTLEGCEFDILLDGKAPKGEGMIQGRTPSDKVVLVEGENSMLGRFARIKVTRSEHWRLHGKILKLKEPASGAAS